MNIDGVVKIAGWERFRWMRSGFSARRGGVSSAYGGKSLNLGWKAEDEDANVAENRRRFVDAICGESHGEGAASLVTVRQVHRDAVQVVRDVGGLREKQVPPLRFASVGMTGGRAVLEVDGLITDLPGVMLGIQVADCVPVLVADVRRRVVGAFHAGWRGTLAGIVGKGVARMGEEYGSEPGDMVAAVGPSIGPCCYTVGEEVRTGFAERFGYWAELVREMRLDLWEANRRQLVDMGVPAANVSVLGECTACARDANGERSYFSHRAEGGFTGRMMGAIGLVGS